MTTHALGASGSSRLNTLARISQAAQWLTAHA